MKRTLYTGRYVLPISAPPISDGALLVMDDKIEAVGRRKNLLTQFPGTDIVDFGDSIILPPMSNAHTHLELTNYKRWAERAKDTEPPQGFVDWILKLVKVKQTVNEQEIMASIVKGLQCCLEAGTGVVGDILTTLQVAEAYRESPLSGTLFAEVLGHDTDVVSKRLKSIEPLVSIPPGRNLTWGVSPHAPYTLSDGAMGQVSSFSSGFDLQCSIHLAESPEETQFLMAGTGEIAARLYAAARWDPEADPAPGCSPVAAMFQRDHLRKNDVVVHGVQVDDEDIHLLKKSACSVVLCPRSNASLGVGKVPLSKYLEAAVPLALGTDSLASAPSLSIWDELAFAQEWFDGNLPPRQWLDIATRGGSAALGRNEGTLSSKSRASFQVVTVPGKVTTENIEETLCRAGQGLDVCQLYLGGQSVMSKT